MRGRFRVDPERCAYGAATPAVRQLLGEWMAIDWFEPPTGAASRGVGLFKEHNARARAHLPERFPERLRVSPSRGRWPEFSALCGRVQKPSDWDWKYGSLKRLSHEHTKRCGLELRGFARNVGIGAEQGLGDLFFCLGDSVIWNSLGPGLDWGTAGKAPEGALWYADYAGMDAIAAIEWQLADKSDRLDTNPFVPLLRCYAAGFYPFSLGLEEVTLFAFEA